MASMISDLFSRIKLKRPTVHYESREEDSSQVDINEEYCRVQKELRQIKNDISQQSKRNFELENDLRFFDSKIAHLINHRITVEELENRLEETPPLPGNLQDSFQNQLYGQLFFLLQTNPMYIAKLSREVSLKEIDGLLQLVMFGLYGNHYEDREEFHLLSMFEHCLTYEFQEAIDINSLMRANTGVTKMMTNYTRRGPGQEYVKSSLGSVIEKLVGMNNPLELHPIKIYQDLLDNEEVKRVNNEQNILLDEAEANPMVQQRIKERVPMVQDIVLSILRQLRNTIDEVPYGIRWLCKAIRKLIKEKFPDASDEHINSMIGGFFFLRYINPTIATPHAYRIIPNPPGSVSRRNCTVVTKVIQKLANTASVREASMKPLEPFVKAHNEELKVFLGDLCDVPDFHEGLQIEEYIALSRRDIHIELSLNEITTIHCLLIKYQDHIVQQQTDSLLDVLKSLPAPIGERQRKDNATVKIMLDHSCMHVECLSPIVKAIELKTVDEVTATEKQIKLLLIRLFKMIPKCMQEATLKDALRIAQTSVFEEASTHIQLIQSQLAQLEQLGQLTDGGTLLFDKAKLALPNVKDLLLRYRNELKNLKRVYETILQHTDFLVEQLDAYKEYLVAVRAKVGEMQQLHASTSGSNLFRRAKNNGTHKFTHTQLEKEGIIIETHGIPQERRNNIYYMFSSTEPGIYKITMHYKGHPKAIYQKNIHLEDLLELQHLRDPILDMEGFVLLNVRRTLLLLNRTFIKGETPLHRPISRHFGGLGSSSGPLRTSGRLHQTK
ncbi:uncharacterized protein [Dysidea avara]|uniref:uncharacterized protein n=1 Tax=Dysidea avara TaxID=196820 RepID=UPI003316C2BD